MSADGKIIEFNRGQARFMQSLLVNKGTLFAGDYYVMVDAAWNSESANYMDFRDVLIDIYCPKPV